MSVQPDTISGSKCRKNSRVFRFFLLRFAVETQEAEAPGREMRCQKKLESCASVRRECQPPSNKSRSTRSLPAREVCIFRERFRQLSSASSLSGRSARSEQMIFSIRRSTTDLPDEEKVVLKNLVKVQK